MPAVAPFAFDRSPWRLEPGISYLNHGGFGACPDPVLEAQRVWRDRMEAEPSRFFGRELEGQLDEARRTMAAFLGADAEDLAFVANTTAGVSTVLGSLRFAPGDELLATDHEYNASLNALRWAAARDGATVVIAPVPYPVRDPSEVVDGVLSAVTPRTRFALVSQVTSPTALIFPVAAIVRELDRRGVDTLVDGAHAVGMVPVDLAAIGAAYWTGNTHKWLCGPKSAAVLHVRADLRNRIRPLVVSHGANAERRDRTGFRLQFDWTGTWDPSPVLALPAVIRYVGGLHEDGWGGLMAANAALARRGRDLVCRALDVGQPAPDSMLGAMAAIPLPNVAPSGSAALRLQEALFEEARIEVPVIAWPVDAARAPSDAPSGVVVRVSAQRYNVVEEYAHLGEVLARRQQERSPRGLVARLRRG
jgi:isopenicillin-N epimerase